MLLLRDASHDFFYLCWTSFPIHLVVLLALRWLRFTILKTLNSIGQLACVNKQQEDF